MDTEQQIVFYTLSGRLTKAMLMRSALTAKRLKAKVKQSKEPVK